VHWDEFHFLRYVYLNLWDQLPPRQSFHGHLFWFLPHVTDNEIDQIIVGRRILLVLQASSWAALIWVGRKLVDSLSAVVGITILLSVTYYIIHGIEFRYDPLITSLAIWACVLNVMLAHPVARVGAGVLYAIALMVSLKSALFGVPIVLSLLVELEEPPSWRRALRRTIEFSLGFFGALLLLGGYHYWASIAPVRGVSSSTKGLVDRLFYWDARFPEWRAFRNTLRHDRFAWLFFLLGITLSCSGICYRSGAARRAVEAS
jgi:hypothetical protein